MGQKVVKVIDLVPGSTSELPSIRANTLDSESFWTEYVCKHVPVIIRGAASDWPAVRAWQQPGYLEARCGNGKLGMSRTFNIMASARLARLSVNKHVRTLAESMREMRAAPDHETYSVPSISVPPQWAPDLGNFSFLARKYDRSPQTYRRQRLFIYKNASTEWHYHSLDETLTTQLVGAKRVSLFRLDATNWDSYSLPIQANIHHMSCGPSYFPPAAELNKVEGVLQAGDALYLPPFWWHGIDPADSQLGITLAQCFRTPLRRLGAWQEPATRQMLSDVYAQNKALYVYAMGMLAVSSLSRLVANERW